MANKQVESLLDQLRSEETWERVHWLMRFKLWKEAPPSTPITKKDTLPIVIVSLISILLLSIAMLFALNVVKIISLTTVFVLPIVIPTGLIIFYCIDYFITKYLIKRDKT